MDEQSIGNYRILRKIDGGGMAKVYLAVHQDVPNLKVILKLLSDPSLVGRFRQEADKLALLDGNPNICRIKHFFSQGEDTVIAMEYIDGVTLDDRVKLGGKMTEAEALPIIGCVLDVLEFAHLKGVYHRDIKPSNIMIDKSGQVRVIDFGIAKGKTDPNLTMTGGSCGTPSYMAPEQFTPSEDMDYAKVDIYATGTTLYVMLTGQLPFSAANEFVLRDSKLFTDPPKPRSLNPDISKQLESIILRAIAKEPSARFSSAIAMKQAIDALPGKAAKSAVTRNGSTQWDKPTPATASGHTPTVKWRVPIWIGVAAAIVVVALVGYFVSKPIVGIAPVLDQIDDQPIVAGSSLMFGVTATGSDNTTPILSARDIPSGATFAPSSGVFEWTPQTTQVGNHRVVFYATDSRDSSVKDSEIVTITVSIMAAPPPASTLSTLSVSVNPLGDIYLDNNLIGSRSRSVDAKVTEGQHVVRVENGSASNSPIVDTVVIKSGQQADRSYTFAIVKSPPETKTLVDPSFRTTVGAGSVVVISRPTIGADIYIDDKLQSDKTPYTFKNLPAGRHEIRATLVLDGTPLERAQTVDIKPDSTLRVYFDFDK